MRSNWIALAVLAPLTMARFVLFPSVQDGNLAAPTANYFSAYYPVQATSGVVYAISQVQATRECVIRLPSNTTITHLNQSSWFDRDLSTSGFTTTYLLVMPLRLENQTGCKSYAAMAVAAQSFARVLVNDYGYPSLVVLVLGAFLSKNETDLMKAFNKGPRGMSGGPAGDAYKYNGPTLDDRRPAIPTVIMPNRTIGLQMMEVLERQHGGAYATLVMEPGPWNAVVLSPWYRLYMFTLLVVNCMALAAAAIRLFFVPAAHIHKLHVTMYTTTIFASFCLVLQMLQSPHMWLHRLLDTIVGWIHSTTYLVVLLHWVNMLKQLNLAMLHPVCVLVIWYNLGVNVIRIGSYVTELGGYEARKVWMLVSQVLTYPAQPLTAMVFLMCVIVLYRAKREVKEAHILPKESMLAFNRLLWLSIVGFVTLVAINVLNHVLGRYAVIDSVPHMIGRYMLRYVVSTVRGVALLLLLNLSSKGSPPTADVYNWFQHQNALYKQRVS